MADRGSRASKSLSVADPRGSRATTFDDRRPSSYGGARATRASSVADPRASQGRASFGGSRASRESSERRQSSDYDDRRQPNNSNAGANGNLGSSSSSHNRKVCTESQRFFFQTSISIYTCQLTTSVLSHRPPLLQSFIPVLKRTLFTNVYHIVLTPAGLFISFSSSSGHGRIFGGVTSLHRLFQRDARSAKRGIAIS